MQQNKLREELGSETLWGLPKHISDELVETYPLRIFRKIGKWLFIIAMFANLGILAWIWTICAKLIEDNAIQAAEQIHGFAYQSNFGIGLLIGLFVSIAFAGVITCIIIRVVPMPAKGALFIGTNEQPPREKGKRKKSKKKLVQYLTAQSQYRTLEAYGIRNYQAPALQS